MGVESSSRAPVSLIVLVAVILAFTVAACLLEDKIIIDEYDAVFGLSEDATQEITNIRNTLTGDYCIGVDRKVQLSSKITQGSPGPTKLEVELAIRDATDVELGSQVFVLESKALAKGSNFKKHTEVLNVLTPGNCVPAGGSVYVAVTPRGGSIEQNAVLKSRARVW
jgi:hypothetical protein